MRDKYLKDAVRPLDLEKISTVSDLMDAFNRTSFQSRNLARCVEVLTLMLRDLDRPTVFLGLAGAMIPAGMGGVIVTLVKRGIVDVIASTGANMYHDLVGALGESHYIGSPEVDDNLLYQLSIDRIYDTFADERQFRKIDKRIEELAGRLAREELGNISSRYLLSRLGEFIEENGTQ